LEQFAGQYAWPVAPAKRRFRFRKQVNHGMQEGHRLALTLRGVIDRSIDDDEGLQSSDYSTYQIFEKDNLVFKLIDLENIKTSRVGHVPRRGIMSPAYIRLERVSAEAFPRYYYWLFYAAYLNNIFNGMGGGVR
jgi:type I restriction enzyme S subunit